jgi:hypothetical protein
MVHTLIAPSQLGAGSRLAEMRGDMPGNFFSSISRFPAQDAVIIVLPNGYGSSEHLEASLQAVLFDQRSHLPWRKPGDVLVHSLQSLTAWVRSHTLLSLVMSVLCLSLPMGLRQRRRTSSATRLA